MIQLKCAKCGIIFQRNKVRIYCSNSCSARHKKITKRPPEERFWKKVSKSEGCWAWTGAAQPRGYGTFWNGNRRVFAHRFAWESKNGPIPDGLLACHKCDNPNCVNPDHIFIGTSLDNTQDAWAKNRFPLGEERRGTKLTGKIVKDMREDYFNGLRLYEIAKKFGMSRATVTNAVYRKTWRHI